MILRVVMCISLLSACGRIGFRVIDDDGANGGSGTTCHPAPERCNGIDDSCDGEIDEGCACMPFDVSFPTSQTAGLAWLGNGYALLTYDGKTTATLIIIDQAGNQIASQTLPGTNPSPAGTTQSLAWTGSEIIAVWVEGSQVELGRFSPTAEPIGTPIVVDSGTSSPFVAWAGDQLVIAWLNVDAETIEVREVGLDGAPLRQLQIGGAYQYAVFSSFAVSRDSYAVTWNQIGYPDHLVLVDRQTWTVGDAQSLPKGSFLGSAPRIAAGADGTFALIEPDSSGGYLQIRGRDGAQIAAPTLVPAYSTPNEFFLSTIAPFGAGFRVMNESFTEAWDESFDLVSQSYSAPVLRASYPSSTISQPSAVTASGRVAMALTLGPMSIVTTTRLLQICP